VHAVLGGKAFDSFLAERSCEEILAAAIGDDRTDALVVIRGEESNWTRVIDEARSRSLFATKRAVFVRNAELLKGEGTEVAEYVQDPTPEVLLLVLAAKVDKRRLAWKKLLEVAQVTPAEPLKGRALESFVSQEARKRGLALSGDAVSELVERVGQDLRRVLGEFDKLEAFTDGRKSITADDVAAVLGRGFSQPLYKLGDAAAARNAPEVLKMMGGMLEEGPDAAFMILGAVHRSLRQVRGALGLKAARASRDVMLTRLGLRGPFEFKLNGLLEAASRWTDAELAGAFKALHAADLAMKSGADASAALTAAMVQACGSGARRGPRTSR
jgi:DNA polymerase-3 subunit delta